MEDHMNNKELLETGISWDDLEYKGYLVYSQGKPFTGTAIETYNNHLQSQTEFVNGIQQGVSQTWSESGQILIDEKLYQGVLHGMKYTWHDTGTIASKSLYDRGHCLYQISWDEDGKVLENYQIDKTHSNYERVSLDRERYPDWPEILAE